MGQSIVTSDLFYDLVSIQYHALKGQEVYAKFCQDAKGNDDALRFIEQVRAQDIERAERCHDLLTRLSTGEPYPAEGQTTGTRQKTGTSTR